MTADASPSPPARTAERPRVELAAAGLLPPLPRAYLEGRDLDLLAPLRLLAPGAELPAAPSAGSAERPDRRLLAAGLRAANRAYGHPGADRLSDLLADPATAVVVTGQQPGLFGGPLYTLAKMVAAARWAEVLERPPGRSSGDGGRAAVAVFWVATEDHDWSEVSRATFLSPEGPRRFDLGPDPDPLLPVGMRTLGPGVVPILEALPELGSSERYERWVATLAGIYRPDARFGEAFCRWAVALLGERCPLLVDAMDPAVKRAEAPWLARLVERRAQWEQDAAAAERRIGERGHPLQVQPQRGASPLFELRAGERRRIEWAAEGGRYRLRGVEEAPRPVGELLERIADNPGTVSPGVLARPAVQDAVLGTALQVVGPGELSYLAQAAPAYRLLEVEAPSVALRPQVLVLETHHRAKLEELELPLAAVLGPERELERRLAGSAGAGAVERARGEIEAVLSVLQEEALALEPDLERPFEKTRDQVLRALEAFAGRATAAAARRDEVASGRVERLRAVCLPDGAPQERVVSSSHFPGKYGDRFAEALFEQMELDGRHLQVIEP